MNTTAHNKHVFVMNDGVCSLTGLPVRKKNFTGADALALPPYQPVVNAKKFTGAEDNDDELLIPPPLIPRNVECESCRGAGTIFNQLSGQDDVCLLCDGLGHTGGPKEFENVDASVAPSQRIAGPTPTVKNKRDDDLLLPHLPMFAPVTNAEHEPESDSDLLLPPGPMCAPIVENEQRESNSDSDLLLPFVTNDFVSTTTIEEAQQNRKNMKRLGLDDDEPLVPPNCKDIFEAELEEDLERGRFHRQRLGMTPDRVQQTPAM